MGLCRKPQLVVKFCLGRLGIPHSADLGADGRVGLSVAYSICCLMMCSQCRLLFRYVFPGNLHFLIHWSVASLGAHEGSQSTKDAAVYVTSCGMVGSVQLVSKDEITALERLQVQYVSLLHLSLCFASVLLVYSQVPRALLNLDADMHHRISNVHMTSNIFLPFADCSRARDMMYVGRWQYILQAYRTTAKELLGQPQSISMPTCGTGASRR